MKQGGCEGGDEEGGGGEGERGLASKVGGWKPIVRAEA